MPEEQPKPRGPKKQHYVPQFLLRNFADSAERIFIFDKHTGQVRQQAVREVAHENRTYEIKTDSGETLSLEQHLGKIEAKCAPVIANLISATTSVNDLTSDERKALSIFAAVQIIRVPHLRNNLLATNNLLLNEILARAGPNGVAEGLLAEMQSFDKEAAKRMSLASIVKNSAEFASILCEKRWIIQTAVETQSFCIGDNPIARKNDEPESFRGNLGLKCDGIEIYFPLSSRVTLAFFDPKLVERNLISALLTGNAKEVECLQRGNIPMLNAQTERFDSR